VNILIYILETNDSSARAKLAEEVPECTCLNLRKAARAVTQLFDGMLQPSGLRATQFSLLAAVHNTGSITIKQLAERLVMDRTTLTRNLKPLEKQEFITISSGKDRRTRLVALTEAGRQALMEALPLWEKAQGEVVNRLGSERWRYLLAMLYSTVGLTWQD
jgi:DNA-binding MarR family transcriptional regulator